MCSYSGGCRCDACRTKQRERMRKYVANRRAINPEWGRRRFVTMRKALPLSAALEACDMAAVCQELLKKSATTELGCWEWPILDSHGYPAYSGGALHRYVLEAKCGAPLGVQQAHHMCANRKCVNPDHLQPVTHRDNMAEMHQRKTYLARIDELEQALTEVAPDHPALNTVPVL